jgi:hypothetical protein
MASPFCGHQALISIGNISQSVSYARSLARSGLKDNTSRQKDASNEKEVRNEMKQTTERKTPGSTELQS